MSHDAAWQLVLPTGQQVALGRSELRLGREEGSCDVLLPSAKVSRVHATVWVDEQGQAWVRDLNSANGTAVDGRRVSEHALLRGGAVLKLADLELRVAHREAPRPAEEDGADRGYAFVRGSAPWAALDMLPAASPSFDAGLALETLEAEEKERAARMMPVPEIDDSGSSLAKVLGLFTILLLAAVAFFALSSGKLEKRIGGMLPEKSDFQAVRRESLVMQPTMELLSSGRLAAKPIALCNRSDRPLRVLWVAATVPVPTVMPDQSVVGSFNSDNCAQGGLGVELPPGQSLSGAALAAETACQIPSLAYHAAVEYVPAGEEASYWAAATFGKDVDCVPLTVEEQP
jgi:hypothetical protein